MNVLLDNDVAGEQAVLDPIAQTKHHRRSTGVIEIDSWTVVISRAGHDFTQCAAVNTLDQLDIGRRHADLKTDIEAEPSLGFLAYFEHALRAGNVDSDRLFTIDVLTRGHRGRQVLTWK